MQMHKTLQIPRVFLFTRLFQTSLLHRCVHADARNGLPGSGGWFLVLPTSFFWRCVCVCVCVSAKCEYGLPETQEIGTVPHFRLSRRQKCCTVPIFGLPGDQKIGTVQHFRLSKLQKCCTVPIFGLQVPIKCCTVPKKPKKPILPALPALEPPVVPKRLVF